MIRSELRGMSSLSVLAESCLLRHCLLPSLVCKVKFVEEGRDADMDRVMEEVQTPTSPAEKDTDDSSNSTGKI